MLEGTWPETPLEEGVHGGELVLEGGSEPQLEAPPGGQGLEVGELGLVGVLGAGLGVPGVYSLGGVVTEDLLWVELGVGPGTAELGSAGLRTGGLLSGGRRKRRRRRPAAGGCRKRRLAA